MVNQDAAPAIIYDDDEMSEDTSFYCTLKIFPSSQERWILGAPFLSDFYQVYDLQRNQVGLVPSKYINSNPEKLN